MRAAARRIVSERVSAEIERIEGGDGDDHITTGGGTDRTIDGGAGNDVAVVENALEGSIASSLGCERVVIGDPSVSDPTFDGLFGTAHPGKTTGSGALRLPQLAVGRSPPTIRAAACVPQAQHQQGRSMARPRPKPCTPLEQAPSGPFAHRHAHAVPAA